MTAGSYEDDAFRDLWKNTEAMKNLPKMVNATTAPALEAIRQSGRYSAWLEVSSTDEAYLGVKGTPNELLALGRTGVTARPRTTHDSPVTYDGLSQDTPVLFSSDGSEYLEVRMRKRMEWLPESAGRRPALKA